MEEQVIDLEHTIAPYNHMNIFCCYKTKEQVNGLLISIVHKGIMEYQHIQVSHEQWIVLLYGNVP